MPRTGDSIETESKKGFAEAGREGEDTVGTDGLRASCEGDENSCGDGIISSDGPTTLKYIKNHVCFKRIDFVTHELFPKRS